MILESHINVYINSNKKYISTVIKLYISMYKVVESLGYVKVEVFDHFIFNPYILLRKTLIMATNLLYNIYSVLHKTYLMDTNFFIHFTY